MSTALAVPYRLKKPAISLIVLPLKLFHLWVSLPVLMFFVGLTAMLFRPPDLKSFPIDRVAFSALVAVLAIRLCIYRESLRTFPASWPLLALLMVGLWGALTQPNDPQAWSLFAAKWMIPFVLFHIAGLVFHDERSLRNLEIFLLMVLVYLSVISILSLIGPESLIFPRFITDEGIGIHTDRARGPFLQAVANGVCLNLLGLIALDSFRRGKLRGIVAALLFLAEPLALLATKTRAVWISAAFSAILLACFGSTRKLRRIALAWCLMATVGLGILFLRGTEADAITERALDRSPVAFRTEMYSAGWQMFTEKPALGWGNEWVIQPEVEKRISTFRLEYYVFHNTFLELAVERGLFGLGLYVWLMICMFRLGKSGAISDKSGSAFTNAHFRNLWPILLGVYLLNASAVVMNYQFVNAVLFTIAGILAAQTASSRSALSPQKALVP